MNCFFNKAAMLILACTFLTHLSHAADAPKKTSYAQKAWNAVKNIRSKKSPVVPSDQAIISALQAERSDRDYSPIPEQNDYWRMTEQFPTPKARKQAAKDILLSYVKTSSFFYGDAHTRKIIAQQAAEHLNKAHFHTYTLALQFPPFAPSSTPTESQSKKSSHSL